MFDIDIPSHHDKRLYPDQPIKKHGRLICPEAWVYAKADPSSPRITQYTYGEPLGVMGKEKGFLYVQSKRDAYCGWIEENAFQAQEYVSATHYTRFNTPITQEANLKSMMVLTLPRDCLLTIDKVEGDYYHVADVGWAHQRHVSRLEQRQSPLSTARALLGQSYVWGGRGVAGLDCSALSQLCYRWAGKAIPRDADLQACYMKTHHQSVAEQDLQAEDLLFIPGHVMLMDDDNKVIHASGYDMCVVQEPLAQALERYQANLKERYQLQAYRWQWNE